MILSSLLRNPSYPKKSILEKLVMYRLDISKEALFTTTELPVSDADNLWIHEGYKQITEDHRPIEHVIGYCEFSGHRFTVTGDTLIPRPETEYMIEAVVERIGETTNSEQLIANREKANEILKNDEGSFRKITLLDIGTGCGVLGLSTLLHAGEYISQVVFTDLSAAALAVAKENYAFHKEKILQKIENTQIQFIECSLMDHDIVRETFNTGSQQLIVANLPYIPEGLFTDNTDPSVHKREPKMAFVGGDDGMDLYRIMLEQIVEYGVTSEGLIATSYSPLAISGNITMFLEMMTRQVEILRKEFGKWFEFEEVKTFHFNIRIVKAFLK